MQIENPFIFWPGDFTLFFAVTLELTVRKLLHDGGYDQEAFGAHVDMSGPLKSGNNIHPSENIEEAIKFIQEALYFVGCRVRLFVKEDGESTIAVRLPKGKSFNISNRTEVERILDKGRYNSAYYINLGKRSTVFYMLDEEFGHDWRALANIVQGVIALLEGGLNYVNDDRAA